MQDLKRASSASSTPPPEYSPPSPISTLSTTHSDFTLSVPPGPYHPGDTLRLSLSASASALAHVVGDIECMLEGTSSVELMGKKRYQTAMMVNATMGSGGAAMITSREQHTFTKASSIISVRANKETGGIEHQIAIPTERSCACPGPKNEGLLPSFGASGDEADESSVEWKLVVVIKRKGILKRDIKLSLIIPVTLLPSTVTFYPLTATSSAPMAYTASASSGPAPTLSANLSISTSPSAPNQLNFRLNLTSTPPSLLPSYASIPPADDFGIAFSLSRRAWTMGIEQSKFGDPGGFHWAPRRMGLVSLPPTQSRFTKGWMRVVPLDEAKSGDGMEFEGEYEVPEGCVTVKGCGVAVDWSVHANVSWKRLSRTLSVETPLVLPIS